MLGCPLSRPSLCSSVWPITPWSVHAPSMPTPCKCSPARRACGCEPRTSRRTTAPGTWLGPRCGGRSPPLCAHRPSDSRLGRAEFKPHVPTGGRGPKFEIQFSVMRGGGVCSTRVICLDGSFCHQVITETLRVSLQQSPQLGRWAPGGPRVPGARQGLRPHGCAGLALAVWAVQCLAQAGMVFI